MADKPANPQPTENETDSAARRVLIALLFLLLSFSCIFCSSYSALFFVDRDTIAGGIRARIQADYGPGVLIALAPIDRDQLISELMQDELALQSTPVLVEAGAVSVALLPKITPVQIVFTPTPTPTFTPTPTASPTPTFTPSPTSSGSASTPAATESPAPPNPTSTPAPSTPVTPQPTVPPTPSTTPVPPTNTPTSLPTPTATSTLPPTSTSVPPTPTNSPPSIGSDAVTVAEGGMIVIDVLANDSDIDGVIDAGSLRVTVSPANGSVLIAAGRITYTPNPTFNGTDTLQYSVCDIGGACSVGTVLITVTPVNDPPVAVDDALSLPEDTPSNLNVLVNDSDIDSPVLVISAVGIPAVGTVINNTSSLFYTPPLNYFGPVVFTYTISDGQLTDTATVSLTVTPVNDPPVAQPDTASTAEDTSESINVLANDSDVDGDILRLVSVSAPANGTASINGRIIRYFPDPNFAGTDSFTYIMSDGLLTDTTTVSVSVIAINDPPVAAADGYAVTVNTTLNQPAPGVLANDTDVDSVTLQTVLVSGPSIGTLTLNPDGSFVYTPATDFTGNVTFSYRATDGSASSSSTTVTLSVN